MDGNLRDHKEDCNWLNGGPSNDVLTPGTCEFYIIWKWISTDILRIDLQFFDSSCSPSLSGRPPLPDFSSLTIQDSHHPSTSWNLLVGTVDIPHSLVFLPPSLRAAQEPCHVFLVYFSSHLPKQFFQAFTFPCKFPASAASLLPRRK